jgi:hypothetical protein
MRTDTKVGILGMVYFLVGAFMVGKSIDVLTAPERIGFMVLIAGMYISGYYLAMQRK